MTSISDTAATIAPARRLVVCAPPDAAGSGQAVASGQLSTRPDGPAGLDHVAPSPVSSVELTRLEQLAASAFFSGDVAVVLEDIRALADGLAGAGGATTRRELVAKELASVHAQVNALTTLLGSLLGSEILTRVDEDLGCGMTVLGG
ncbi:MAG: hypothetical protein ACJ79R_10335 [Anaeromyxobacteraceae bacterium]